MLGQIRHELQWHDWYDITERVPRVEFACCCKAWSLTYKVDPIEQFRGTVLSFRGETVGDVVLKAGIEAGREFERHLQTAQVDVIQWAGQEEFCTP